MATLLQHNFTEEMVTKQYDPQQELLNHGWRPKMDSIQAEKALENQPAYTYLLRSSPFRKKYTISFIDLNGKVHHDQFSLIDAEKGIWLNAAPTHIGSLGKVIRDMMDCTMDLGQPL